MIDIKNVNGPTLVAGDFDIIFGEMEKVSDAAIFVESPDISDFKFGVSRSISGNTVTVEVRKIDTTQASVIAWVAATTANLANLDVVVIAKGI